MTVYQTSIDVLIEADCPAELADGLSAILSEQMRKYVGNQSCLIDWRYHEREPGAGGRVVKVPCDTAAYEPDQDPWPAPKRPTLEPLVTF